MLSIACLELLSCLVVFHPTANTVAAFAVACAVGIIAYVRPTLACSIVGVELMIGSKGALLKAFADTQNNGGASLRILIFLAFLIGWTIWAVKNKTYLDWWSYRKGRKIYFILVGLILYAFLLGLVRGNGFLYADANAWGEWLLFLPVIDLVTHRQEKLRQDIVPAIFAGLIWLLLETVALFYFFSHGFSSTTANTVYLWVRRTGVGEVTRVVGNTFRVFLQSHIYAVVGAIFGMTWLGFREEKSGTTYRNVWMLTTLFISAIIISLSRSFWIGMFVALLMMAFVIWKNRRSSFAAWLKTSVAAGLSALLLVACALWFPIPHGGGNVSDLLLSRTDLSENAAMSRWKLLPALWEKVSQHPILGSGFGATVTFESSDPRIIQTTGGVYTAYSFEWGWMDFWIKFGILGIPILFSVLLCLGWRLARASLPFWLKWAAIFVLIAIGSIHFFTPYLNHPLGIGILLAFEGLVQFAHLKEPKQGVSADALAHA